MRGIAEMGDRGNQPPEFAVMDIVPFLFSSSISFPVYLPPLEAGPLIEGMGERCKLPQLGPGSEARPKTNLVHSKAARKPLVEIIWNIVSTMLYSRTIKI